MFTGKPDSNQQGGETIADSGGNRRLSRITGQFLDPEQEQRFREATWPEFSVQLRHATLVCGGVALLSLIVDFFSFPEADLWLLLLLKLLVFATALSLWSLAHRPTYWRIYDQAIFAAESFSTLLLGFAMAVSRSDLVAHALPAALVLLSYYFVIPSRFISIVVNAGALTLAVIVLGFTSLDSRPADILLVSSCLLALNALAVNTLHRITATRRINYLHLAQAREANQVLSQTLKRQADIQKKVREEQQEIQLVFDATPFPLLLVRRDDSVILQHNHAAEDTFKLSLAEGTLTTAPIFFDEAERIRLRQVLLGGQALDREEVRIRTLAGDTKDALLSVKIIELGGTACFVAGFADITSQKALESALQTLATTDSLTSVANRRSFMEHATRELLRAERYKRSLSLLLMDLDDFKNINDKHGHQAGDRVLQAFTQRCLGVLRANDIMGRIGGEEFAVLLPETTGDEAMAVAERLREATAKRPLTIEGASIPFTVSIGLAEMDARTTLDSLISTADTAMYRAKTGGRDRVVRLG